MKMPRLASLFGNNKLSRNEPDDLDDGYWDEYWLRELVRYLLERARHERQATMMDAIDKTQLEAYFGCPLEDLDTDTVALSEWEQVIPWKNMPRLGSEREAKLMENFAVYVVGMALGNRPGIRPEFVHEMFKAETEEQKRLLDEKIDKYRREGQSAKTLN